MSAVNIIAAAAGGLSVNFNETILLNPPSRSVRSRAPSPKRLWRVGDCGGGASGGRNFNGVTTNGNGSLAWGNSTYGM